jgi:hypothetical protein
MIETSDTPAARSGPAAAVPDARLSPGVNAAIDDLLDNVAKVQPDNEVLLFAHSDGLRGSDNLVDAQAISAIQEAIDRRGAHASVLWMNQPDRPHDWGIPRALKAAMQGCDIFINHSFNYVTEENRPLRDYFMKLAIRYVRNFATTMPLLESRWAQTPSALVAEIRYRASEMLDTGMDWVLTDPLGTHLEGKIAAPNHMWFPVYACRREEGGGYLPWPEWVHPPINLSGVSGEVVFDRMLSYWSRYIGIQPFFEQPIRIEVRDGMITKISGGAEAQALERFIQYMEKEKGVGRRYEFNTLHSGVHPNAAVTAEQCPSVVYRRLIEHAHTSNIHMHIGAEHGDKKGYPYWLHITGDIRKPTWRVGGRLVHDQGYLTVLDHPEVRKVAARFPDRPGLPGPRSTIQE